MSLNKIIKSQARRALQGFRGRAIAILLIVMALYAAVGLADSLVFRLLGFDVRFDPWQGFAFNQSFVLETNAILATLAMEAIRVILLVPLGIGALSWYLERTDGRARRVSYLFWPYENRVYFRSILLWLELTVKKLFFMLLLCAVPDAGVLWVLGLQQTMILPLKWIALCLGLVLTFFTWVFLSRYDIAAMLLCEKYQKGSHEAVVLSVRVMKGNKWRLLGFKLTFIWWWLPVLALALGAMASGRSYRLEIVSALCLVALLVYCVAAMLIVVPYYRMAHTMFCRYLYEELQMKQGAAPKKEKKGPAQTQVKEEPEENSGEDPLSQPIQISNIPNKDEEFPADPEDTEESNNDQERYL